MTASVKPLDGATGAECLKYYEEQRENGEREDYYMQEEGHAEMYGRGLDRLAPGSETRADSTREFDRHAVMNMLEGKDAAGNVMVKGAGDGLKRLPGWDVTFSPDKSVSVAWAAASPELRAQIEAAHDRAVRGALDHVQDHFSLANEGKGGATRVQADMSAAIFRHGASRELEPQLHSHCVIPNMAVKADGSVVSLNTRELYQRLKEAGAVYRAELASEMRGLGFDIDRKGDNFRISGVPQDICDQYSTRREQITQAMDAQGAHSAKAAEVAALSTREAKQGVPDSVLLKQWQREMDERGFTAASVEALRGRDRAPSAAMPSHDEFVQRLTANNSTFSKNDVWREAAVAAQGVTDRHGIAEYAQGFLANSKEVLAIQHRENGAIRYTSREMFELERGMVADAGALRASDTHRIDGAALDKAMADFEARKGFALSADQREALAAMTQGGDFVTIQGAAGTGKSASMEVAADAWRGHGFRVRGMAPSGKAATELGNANIESTTIASALLKNQSWTDVKGRQRPPADPFTANDVLLVDEAGMVDSRTMNKLIAAAKKAGAKLVWTGDTKQLPAVGAGGAFNAQQQAMGGADAELSTVVRQKEQAGRDMTIAARNGQMADVLNYLHEREGLHIADDRRGAMQSTVDAWRANYSHANPRSSVMVCNTNTDTRALNDAARAQLKREGVLGGYGIETGVENREGAALGKRDFLEGDRVVFLRNAKLSTGADIKNGQTGSIEAIRMADDGQQHFLVRRDGADDLVDVPVSEYRAVDHAYALNTYKSQGITAEHVSVLAGGRMQNLHSTYVQLSRFTQRVDLSCPKDGLEAEMMKHAPTPGMTQYAQDLAKQHGIELPEGTTDNFRLTRDFLNQCSPQQLENGKPVDPWRQDIGRLAEAMGQERIKETTLDYDLAPESGASAKHDKGGLPEALPSEKSEKPARADSAGAEPSASPMPSVASMLGGKLSESLGAAKMGTSKEMEEAKRDGARVMKAITGPASKIIPGLGGLER